MENIFNFINYAAIKIQQNIIFVLFAVEAECSILTLKMKKIKSNFKFTKGNDYLNMRDGRIYFRKEIIFK